MICYDSSDLETAFRRRRTSLHADSPGSGRFDLADPLTATTSGNARYDGPDSAVRVWHMFSLAVTRTLITIVTW